MLALDRVDCQEKKTSSINFYESTNSEPVIQISEISGPRTVEAT
jgi:hypothetical protein